MDTRKRRKDSTPSRSYPLDILQTIPKRPRVQAQRKFALGAPVLPLSHMVDVPDENLRSSAVKPSKDIFFGNKNQDLENASSNGIDALDDVVLQDRPKTEDFLTFLCFRGTPLLPPSLDHFNNPQVPYNNSLIKPFKEGDFISGIKNNRTKTSTDDNTTVPTKEYRSKSTDNSSNVKTAKSVITQNGGLKALQHKHSSRLLNARKKLLKKALELKSKSIRATRLSSHHGTKRLTRSSDVRKLSPDKKLLSTSVERKERAVRRQQLIDERNIDEKQATVTRSRSFDCPGAEQTPALLRSRSSSQDIGKRASSRISRNQISLTTDLTSRKKAKLTIRPKAKISRLLKRLGTSTAASDSSTDLRLTRSNGEQLEEASVKSVGLSFAQKKDVAEIKKKLHPSEIKVEVKQEESEEERRKSTRALRMVRKEETVTFYARRSDRLPSLNTDEDVKPDVSQVSTSSLPARRPNSYASNSSPNISSCSSPSLSPKVGFSRRLQKAANEVPYRNTRQSSTAEKTQVTVTCVAPKKEVLRCVRSAPASRQASPNLAAASSRKTRQSADQLTEGPTGVCDSKAKHPSIDATQKKSLFRRRSLRENISSDSTDDSEGTVPRQKLRNKRLTKRSERTSRKGSDRNKSAVDSMSSDDESDNILRISTGNTVALLNSSVKTEVFSTDEENVDYNLITRRKSLPLQIKRESILDQNNLSEKHILKGDVEINENEVLTTNVPSETNIVSPELVKSNSMSILKKKAASTRRRASSNPQENLLNEVLGSVAKDFGENIDESHYSKMERDLAMGNKSPEKMNKMKKTTGVVDSAIKKKNAGGKKLSEVVKNLTQRKTSGEAFEDQPLFLRGLKNIATATVADCKKQRQVGEGSESHISNITTTTVSNCTTTAVQASSTTTTTSVVTTSLNATKMNKTSPPPPLKGVSKNSRLNERKLPYAPISSTAAKDNVKKPRSAPLFIPSSFNKSAVNESQTQPLLSAEKPSKNNSNPISTASGKDKSESCDKDSVKDMSNKIPVEPSIDVAVSVEEPVKLSSNIFYGSGACKSTSNKSNFRATEIKIPLLGKAKSVTITKRNSEKSHTNITMTPLNIPKVSKVPSNSVVSLTSSVTATYLPPANRPANFEPSGPDMCETVESSVDTLKNTPQLLSAPRPANFQPSRPSLCSFKPTIEGKVSKSAPTSIRAVISEPLIVPSMNSVISLNSNQNKIKPEVKIEKNFAENKPLTIDSLSSKSVALVPPTISNALLMTSNAPMITSFASPTFILSVANQCTSSLSSSTAISSCPQIAPLRTIMTPLPTNVTPLHVQQQNIQPNNITSMNSSMLPLVNTVNAPNDTANPQINNILSGLTPINNILPLPNGAGNVIPTLNNLIPSSLVPSTSSITPPVIYNTLPSYNTNTSLCTTPTVSSGAPVAYFNSNVSYVAPAVVPPQGINTFLPQAPYAIVTLPSHGVPSTIPPINIANTHPQPYTNEMCSIIPIGNINATPPATFQNPNFPSQIINNQNPSNPNRPILLSNAVVMTPQQNSAPPSPAKTKQVNIAPKPNRMQTIPTTVTPSANTNKAQSKPIQIAPKLPPPTLTVPSAINKLPHLITAPHGSHIIQALPPIQTLQTLPQTLQSLQATLATQFALTPGVAELTTPVVGAQNLSVTQSITPGGIPAINAGMTTMPVTQTDNSLIQILPPMVNNEITTPCTPIPSVPLPPAAHTLQSVNQNVVFSHPPSQTFTNHPVPSSITNDISLQSISFSNITANCTSINETTVSETPQITLTSSIRGELPLSEGLSLVNKSQGSSDAEDYLTADDVQLTVDESVNESCEEDYDSPTSPPIPYLSPAKFVTNSSLPIFTPKITDMDKEPDVPKASEKAVLPISMSTTESVTCSDSLAVVNTNMATSSCVTVNSPPPVTRIDTPSRSMHLAVIPVPMPKITRNAIPRQQHPLNLTHKVNSCASMIISTSQTQSDKSSLMKSHKVVTSEIGEISANSSNHKENRPTMAEFPSSSISIQSVGGVKTSKVSSVSAISTKASGTVSPTVTSNSIISTTLSNQKNSAAVATSLLNTNVSSDSTSSIKNTVNSLVIPKSKSSLVTVNKGSTATSEPTMKNQSTKLSSGKIEKISSNSQFEASPLLKSSEKSKDGSSVHSLSAKSKNLEKSTLVSKKSGLSMSHDTIVSFQKELSHPSDGSKKPTVPPNRGNVPASTLKSNVELSKINKTVANIRGSSISVTTIKNPNPSLIAADVPSNNSLTASKIKVPSSNSLYSASPMLIPKSSESINLSKTRDTKRIVSVNQPESNANKKENTIKHKFASSSVTLQPVERSKKAAPVDSSNEVHDKKKEPIMKRTLFKTKSKEYNQRAHAFSVVNESSVYAFEPEVDSVVESSPFSKRLKNANVASTQSNLKIKSVSVTNKTASEKIAMESKKTATSNTTFTDQSSKKTPVNVCTTSTISSVRSSKEKSNVVSDQPKLNSRTAINQKLKNSRASLHVLASLDSLSSDSNSTSVQSSVQCSPITSPNKNTSSCQVESQTTSPITSLPTIENIQEKINLLSNFRNKNFASSSNSSVGIQNIRGVEKSIVEKSKDSQVQSSPSVVETSTLKKNASTDSKSAGFFEKNKVSSNQSKGASSEQKKNTSAKPTKVVSSLEANKESSSEPDKKKSSETKKGVEIAIQCDMDDPMASFFRGSESGTQTDGAAKLPLPPSASPFYYLPLAMAALGEKLPAQLVQQMLAKTQGYVGAAEAGMILQQAAQLAQEHQQKAQQQETTGAPLPEPPPVAKPVPSMASQQQFNSDLTPEESILIQRTPIAPQLFKPKQSSKLKVQRLSHVPVIAAPTHLSRKSVAVPKSSSIKASSSTSTTVTSPPVKSPPVYITPPTNRINSETFLPNTSVGENHKTAASAKSSKTSSATSTTMQSSKVISESFVKELNNKLLAVHQQNASNERIKQSRSHSLEKETSSKKQKTADEESNSKIPPGKTVITKAGKSQPASALKMDDKPSKQMTNTPPVKVDNKQSKEKQPHNKEVKSKTSEEQCIKETITSKSNKSKASPSKTNPSKKMKTEELPEDEDSMDSGRRVRRSNRSSTSASTRATESDQHGAELMKRHRRAKRAAAALVRSGDSGCLSPSSDSLPPPLSPQMSPDTLRGWPPPRLTSPSPSQSSTSSSASQRSMRTSKGGVNHSTSALSSASIQSPRQGGRRLQRSSSVGGCSSNSSTVTSIGTSGGSWHPDPLIAEAAPPRVSENTLLTRAPSFFPSVEEFNEPLDYIEKIRPEAERFGICRIVPPASFRPECRVNDDMRFTVHNQYIHKLMNRWGPNARTTQAIKRCLSKQNINMDANPLLGGLEMDLVQLYRAVEQLGGLMTVLEQQLWGRVAQLCRIPKTAHDRLSKLDSIYCKYLLPYATLTPKEREMLLNEADHVHAKATTAVDCAIKERKAASFSDEEESEDEQDEGNECLECFTVGKSVSLSAFYRLARNTTAQWLPDPNGMEVDERYWSIVNEGTRHVCVHEASIDTAEHGYGFPSPRSNGAAKHPWNLKNLCQNNNSVLRSMGNVIGVTSPTLHVGMLFSSVCWYRDPHSLPWIEYIHSGASKIWYGVGSSHETILRDAMKKIVPEYVKDSPVWLPADSIMVDPNALAEQEVPVCRVVQEPGQFVIIFPGAFTSSLCTGYLIAESVFFAKHQYFDRAKQSFDLLAKCGEPAMFSFERLVASVTCDSRATLESLLKARPYMKEIVDWHTKWRGELSRRGIKKERRISPEEAKSGKARGRKGSGVRYEENEQSVCVVCKQEQYLAMVVCEDSRGEVYCVQHAAQSSKRDKIEDARLLYRHTLQELQSVLRTLDERIQMKTSKRSLGAVTK